MRKWKHFRLKAVIAAVSLSGALIAGSTLAWFTDEAEVAPTTFKAGTVDIEAGGISYGTPTDEFYQMIPYELVAYHQNPGVADARKIPADATEVNEFILERISQRTAPGYRPDESQFYSLGKSGNEKSFIELELNRPLDVVKGIRVIECSWDKPNTEEKANVYVSSTGNDEDWRFIKTVSNRDEGSNVNHQHTSIIQIPNSVGTVNFIRIEDCTTSSSPDGYDIDFLGVYLLDENNWNPGDTNYVAYEINNVGTKTIKLRASLAFKWQETVDGEEWFDTNDSTDNVVILPANGSNWTYDSGYYYYSGTLSGSYNDSIPGSAMLYLSVQLKGEQTGNDYQGKRLVLTPTFQAVQNSHSSGEDGWTWEGVFPTA